MFPLKPRGRVSKFYVDNRVAKLYAAIRGFPLQKSGLVLRSRPICMGMSLETTLNDTIARLRQGRFPNEQAISQGVVLRVLQELGWDIQDH